MTIERIEELREEIQEVKAEMANFEMDPYEYEDQYCEALDEEGPVVVVGMSYDPSHILREVDPTAYRCGLLDYVDSLDKEDDEEYQELEERLEELEDELTDLESEMEEEEED